MLEKSNITAIYKKKGPKDSPESYRPISLLSNVAKVLERTINNAIYDYCISNVILKTNNSGFKRGLSTTTHLVNIVDVISRGFDTRKNTIMVYLDIKSAFNQVW